MGESTTTSVRERQDPLRERYKTAAGEADITDCARSTDGVGMDPFHGIVVPGDEESSVDLAFGIHRAVGGYHDAPNPGDMLCAALAACLDSTLRMIAERIGVALRSLEVNVVARADVRGTLLVDRATPVGFRSIDCRVDLQTAEGSDPASVQKLLAAAEHSCVVLQTLRSGVAVETNLVG